MDRELIDFLSALKEFGIENNIPNVSERTGRFLNMLVKISKSKNILEIGCANGYSTVWLADAAYKNKGKIIAIDFSRPTFDAAHNNLKEAGLFGVVDFCFGNALKIIPDLTKPKRFDFVFVDGEKRSYWDFWAVIKGRLNKNAIVVFDDVIKFPDKTKKFMDKIKHENKFEQLILPIDGNDGILLLYKCD